MYNSNSFNRTDKADILDIIKNNEFEICSDLNGNILIDGFNTHLYSLKDIRKNIFKVDVCIKKDLNSWNPITDLKILLVSSLKNPPNDTINDVILSYLHLIYSISKEESAEIIESVDCVELSASLIEHCKIISSEGIDVDCFLEYIFDYAYISTKSCYIDDKEYSLFKL